MGSIHEQSRWAEDIYRIQKTDPVLGGEDGIINIQPEQLANRTHYLKDLLETEHTADGRHVITDEMLADDAAIPESKLDLDYATAELQSEYQLAAGALDVLKTKVEALVGVGGFFIEGLVRVVQLNWKYGEYRYDFEFFADGLTMRDMHNIDSRRAIAQDDSVDCENTTSMAPGMRLLLFDDTHSEEVEIRSVLEDGRIRLVSDISRTFDDSCTRIGYTNWDLSTVGKASVTNGKYYYTKFLSVLDKSVYGTLMICRDKGAGTLKVEYRDVSEAGIWQTAELNKVFPHDTDSTKCYEHYTITGSNLQIRISGTSDTAVDIYHMAVFPDPNILLEYSVRTPRMTLPDNNSEAWQDMLLLESSEFFSAYRDYYVQTEYGFFDAVTGELKHTISARTIQMQMITDDIGMPEAGEYLLRARHQSDVSDYSAWSKPVKITLHKARILFSLFGDYERKAAGFDDGEFDYLGFYPIRFGFEGARLSEGFDSVLFTTKLED